MLLNSRQQMNMLSKSLLVLKRLVFFNHMLFWRTQCEQIHKVMAQKALKLHLIQMKAQDFLFSKTLDFYGIVLSLFIIFLILRGGW